MSRCHQLFAEVVGTVVGELGGFAQALLTHQREIDRHEEGHEALVRADVRSGLLAADVLLAGLKRQYEATLGLATAVGLGHVVRHADNAAWHLADELLCAAHIAHVRTSELHGDAQRLSVAYGNVGSPLARCLQEGEVEGHAVHDEECLLLVAAVGKALVVLDDAVAVRLLDDDAGNAVEC